MHHRPIALITDFGLRDHYVGSLKGVILSINPKATIFDVTHDIRPQNIREAAFVLNSVYSCVPKGTIFVVVVDPGVGSQRRALCVRTPRAWLVGPDNGVLSLVLASERKAEIRFVTNDAYFRKPVSTTFHGRDIFSPVAAWLSRRDLFRSLGPTAEHVRMIPFPTAQAAGNWVRGQVIYIDRFGNAITNIGRDLLARPSGGASVCIKAAGKRRVRLKAFFSEGKERELIAVWNSSGALELAVRNDSAEARFRIKVGDPVTVGF